MKEEKSTVESNDSKQLNRVSSKTKSEKPFYKKAWFWVVIVVIIAIGSQYKQPEKVGEKKILGQTDHLKLKTVRRRKKKKLNSMLVI